MKTIQKLEIFTGLATLITALLYFYFGYFRLVKDITVGDEIIRFMASVVSLIIPSAMVAVGAYYNSIGRSERTIATISISGFLISLIFVPISFVFFVYGAIAYSLLIIAPTIFAVITLILALYSRKKSVSLS